MLNVAMVGKWHVHAPGYANEFNSQKDSRVIAVWDDDVKRGKEWAEQLNVPFFENYDEMLEKSGANAVCVCSATNRHKELIIKAANAGKHVFTEKVLCLNTMDCDEVISAIEKNKVVFTISFPHRCFPGNLFIKKAIESGMLGDITLFRVRNCHSGALDNWLPDYWYDPETTGGGAMMDLGAHPMYLSAWFLGEPESIQSCFKSITNRPVDDDAVSLIRFRNGATAISETSLVAPYTPMLCEVYGTKGVILSENGRVRIKTSLLQAKDNDGWIVPELPQGLPGPIRQFTDSVLYGKPVLFGTAEARMLTMLMENAYKADREKREIRF